MAIQKNGIIVLGAVFVDIKGFPEGAYIPDGRNAGKVKYVHGGVSRNVVEDIANIELRPTYLGIVDDSALGEDVLRKLERHKVNVSYMQRIPNGMGTWLAVFDQNGDVAGSISQRPNLDSLLTLLEEKGSVYADMHGNRGFCPAKKVDVRDTTGAGDSFCAGVVSGLTYGKTLAESVEIGTRLAASVITSSENVCPRFLPAELGIEA